MIFEYYRRSTSCKAIELRELKGFYRVYGIRLEYLMNCMIMLGGESMQIILYKPEIYSSCS
jgi:hypothetical protein